ncbi:hypothetical protein HELRODRAFT_163997 [Helobdella robusta]|uniref:Uncharacterized protein n=1 Tax=Helobdella robusta TaxID=6412 RepID=T1EUQ6_HELRO|nr:hypothetical protein HELRODRAFT_163997 [Helobdella robusta]ESN94200.1 hypothetical protein HELRODRAFT_163997 [Helobdella robusta]
MVPGKGAAKMKHILGDLHAAVQRPLHDEHFSNVGACQPQVVRLTDDYFAHCCAMIVMINVTNFFSESLISKAKELLVEDLTKVDFLEFGDKRKKKSQSCKPDFKKKKAVFFLTNIKNNVSVNAVKKYMAKKMLIYMACGASIVGEPHGGSSVAKKEINSSHNKKNPRESSQAYEAAVVGELHDGAQVAKEEIVTIKKILRGL